MSTHPIVLRIDQTWDGTPISPDAVVTWEIRDEGTHIGLVVHSPFYGDPPAPDAPPGPTAALWEQEVVELFIAGPGTHYTEIELGPHGHHLVLRLDGIRNIVEQMLPLTFQAKIDHGRWIGTASIPRENLPAGPHRVGAFAIHGSGSERRYLSMVTLPGDQPDFHQLDQLQAIALP